MKHGYEIKVFPALPTMARSTCSCSNVSWFPKALYFHLLLNTVENWLLNKFLNIILLNGKEIRVVYT
jgi:hypothetical protein